MVFKTSVVYVCAFIVYLCRNTSQLRVNISEMFVQGHIALVTFEQSVNVSEYTLSTLTK